LIVSVSLSLILSEKRIDFYLSNLRRNEL